MSSVLENEYVAQQRPYSQNELKFLREKMRRSLRLSEYRADHHKCGHFYHVKFNGRKESEIIEKNDSDVGNCSVCWKLSKMCDLKDEAEDLVDEYTYSFRTNPKILTYNLENLERTFYTWLYADR
jgi:hypothetical protein